jgi:hypothetical protein
MKKIIVKFFIGALSILPLYGHAGFDCGGGTVKYFRTNALGDSLFSVGVNWLEDFPKLNGGNYRTDGTVVLGNIQDPEMRSRRNDIITAFHSGSIVRFFNDVANECRSINQVVVCSSKSACASAQAF